MKKMVKREMAKEGGIRVSGTTDRVVRFVMSWLSKREKLDPVQASAIDVAAVVRELI